MVFASVCLCVDLIWIGLLWQCVQKTIHFSCFSLTVLWEFLYWCTIIFSQNVRIFMNVMYNKATYLYVMRVHEQIQRIGWWNVSWICLTSLHSFDTSKSHTSTSSSSSHGLRQWLTISSLPNGTPGGDHYTAARENHAHDCRHHLGKTKLLQKITQASHNIEHDGAIRYSNI